MNLQNKINYSQIKKIVKIKNKICRKTFKMMMKMKWTHITLKIINSILINKIKSKIKISKKVSIIKKKMMIIIIINKIKINKNNNFNNKIYIKTSNLNKIKTLKNNNHSNKMMNNIHQKNKIKNKIYRTMIYMEIIMRISIIKLYFQINLKRKQNNNQKIFWKMIIKNNIHLKNNKLFLVKSHLQKIVVKI